MQILLSDMSFDACDIFDNYAHQVTHGITLISSELTVRSTTINFSDDFNSKLALLNLGKLDTGFFNLYLGSQLNLSQQTEVRNLVAKQQSVLAASAQSSVIISDGVKFINNNSNSPDGYTMAFENVFEVNITEASFIGNHQTNIAITLGTLSVRNSTFVDGKKRHISA